VKPEVYVNGNFVPRSQAKISVFDRGFLYGDGVFEGIRAYHGRLFRLDEHLARLYRGSRAIFLELAMEQDELREIVLEGVRRSGLQDCYVRLVVSRGEGDLGLDPRDCHTDPSVVVIVDAIRLYPAEMYEQGLNVITCVTRRTHHMALNPGIKSLNYLNNILAKVEVAQAGAHEGIMLNHLWYVAEPTADNIFVCRHGEMVTPPLYAGMLAGITRGVVLELAAEMGLPLGEDLLTPYDVHSSDECFLTGTAAEIVPVSRVDGRAIGDGRPGPITRRLMARFKEMTATEGVPVG